MLELAQFPLLPIGVVMALSYLFRRPAGSQATPRPYSPSSAYVPPNSVAGGVFSPSAPLVLPSSRSSSPPVVLPAPYKPPGVPAMSAASNVSENGIALLKQLEGFAPVARDDGFGHVTLGYGHKVVSGDGFKAGQSITVQAADALLRRDVQSIAVVPILQLVSVPLSQNQFDALASFVFNIGRGNFASSTLLKKLNARDYAGAAAEFARWRFAGSQPVLAGRRFTEASLFNTAVA